MKDCGRSHELPFEEVFAVITEIERALVALRQFFGGGHGMPWMVLAAGDPGMRTAVLGDIADIATMLVRLTDLVEGAGQDAQLTDLAVGIVALRRSLDQRKAWAPT